jgi:hypothetical protein
MKRKAIDDVVPHEVEMQRGSSNSGYDGVDEISRGRASGAKKRQYWRRQNQDEGGLDSVGLE